jgi:hypothetical protein
MRAICLLLAFAVLMTSCASTTLIQTEPSEADVYVDRVKVGKTPYAYSDTKIVGSSTVFTFKKRGFKDFNYVLTRNEQADVGAIVGGVFFLFPFLWTMRYYPSRIFELEPDRTGQNYNTDMTASPHAANELSNLKDLYDNKALTIEEYNLIKEKLLNNTYNYEKEIVYRLQSLKHLLDKGALTQSEYDTQKRKLLSDID